MKKSIVILCLICILDCLTLNAAAGFADAFNDRQQWIYPAYLYNLIFGVFALVCLWIATIIWKPRFSPLIDKLSNNLRKHPIVAIISCGLLLSILIGLCISLLWELMWFMAILPFFVISILFPCILANKKVRERLLLSTGVLKWLIIIDMACCISSFLFIVLTNAGILPNTDTTYLERPGRLHHTYYFPSHPYDSMIEIWSPCLFFIAEIILPIGLYFVGKLNNHLRIKLSAIRHRKMQELYPEEERVNNF